MSNIPRVENDTSAFGELSVSETTPVVQVQFPYNLNTRIVESRDNNGTSSVALNMLKLSTGAAANQSSTVLSIDPIKYNPGQGALVRFTALFESTPAANSTQWIGVGDTGDGYFFGYDGTTFNVMRRKGGVPEVRKFEITTGSSHAENITITLDGDADATVAVTNTASITLTANEIAAHDYSDLGQGWSAHAMGPFVFFTSYNAAAQAGTYSISATSAAATITRPVTGVAATETKTAQASWNHDVMDGSGSSTMTLDQTKGNVYQIRYQWLGFGRISYYIEDDTGQGGKFVLVHEIHFANSAVEPSVKNPTLPMCATVANAANTSDMVLKSGSWGGFVEGKVVDLGISNAISFSDTGTGTTELPLFTIHNHDIYQSLVNRVTILPRVLSISINAAAANRTGIIRIRLNATLTGAVFAAHDSNTSVAHIDSTATAVSGGTIVFADSVVEGGSRELDLEKFVDKLNPPDFLTVTLESNAGTIDSLSTLTWKELF